MTTDPTGYPLAAANPPDGKWPTMQAYEDALAIAGKRLDLIAQLEIDRDQAIHLLQAIVEAECREQLPGDHAINVVLVSVDEFLEGR